MEYHVKPKIKNDRCHNLKAYENFYFKIVNSKLVRSKFKLRLKFE